MQQERDPSEIFGREILNHKVADFRLVDCLYTPDTEMPYHTHEVSHVSLVLGGSYAERYGQRERDCEPATLIVHPQDETHRVAFRGSGAHIFSVHLKPSWVESVRAHSNVLDNPGKFRGLPVSLAVRLYREFLGMDTAAPLAIESLALELVAELSRQGLSEKGVPRWLGRIREVLHARFVENIRFGELAAVAGVHPVYLAREFRRAFRCTMGEYVRRLRVENACRVLAGTETPLAEVANLTGFYDQSHFNNAFKRQTGMTPAQYRAAFRPR